MQRGEFERLPVPGHGRQHLRFARNTPFATEEHDLAYRAGLHRTLQGEKAAGDRHDLKVRRAADPARKADYNRRLLVEANSLCSFAKLSLGGVGHKDNIDVISRSVQITEVG